MRPEELKDIMIDRRYTFHLKDGRDIVRRGIWLAGFDDNGNWCVNPRKAELVESVMPYEN